MRDTSLIEIDLAALDRNYRRIDHLVGRDCRICAVLKADAYGLGAIPIAKRLERGGCGMFALSNPSEAEELWRAGIASDLLVLRPVRVIQDVEAVVEPLSKGQIQLTLHDTAQLPILEKIAIRLEGPLRVHLDLDTGMSRG
ncbi:MAG: alanine racemase, partial [Planctomycetota bacterium]|nr:alanine racemase [Planctomycetota bacterium]